MSPTRPIFVRFVALCQHIDSSVFDYYEDKVVVDGNFGLFTGSIFVGPLKYGYIAPLKQQ